jgi:hypothetical protein
MSLGVNINSPGDPCELEYMERDTRLLLRRSCLYGRLVLDVIKEMNLSIRDDEAAESDASQLF